MVGLSDSLFCLYALDFFLSSMRIRVGEDYVGLWRNYALRGIIVQIWLPVSRHSRLMFDEMQLILQQRGTGSGAIRMLLLPSQMF